MTFIFWICLTYFVAIDRRACIVPAEDVPNRWSCWYCYCWPYIRCTGVKVCKLLLNVCAVKLTYWISNFMRQQAMSSRMVFNRPIPVNRLVSSIADSMLQVLLNEFTSHIPSFQRHKWTHKNTVGVHMVSAFLSSDRIKSVPIFTSSHRPEIHTNIMLCLSEHGAKAQRHTLRNILRASQIVRSTHSSNMPIYTYFHLFPDFRQSWGLDPTWFTRVAGDSPTGQRAYDK